MMQHGAPLGKEIPGITAGAWLQCIVGYAGQLGRAEIGCTFFMGYLFMEANVAQREMQHEQTNLGGTVQRGPFCGNVQRAHFSRCSHANFSSLAASKKKRRFSLMKRNSIQLALLKQCGQYDVHVCNVEVSGYNYLRKNRIAKSFLGKKHSTLNTVRPMFKLPVNQKHAFLNAYESMC